MGKPLAFMYYFEWAEQMLQLPDELRLKIDDAMKRFVLYGEEPQDPMIIYSMFGLMRSRAEADMQAYEQKCEQNRRNIQNRYDRTQPNTNEYDRTQPNTNATNKNKIKETIKEKESKKKSAPMRFTPPTLDEVREFIADNGYTLVNAEAFYNHYEAIGWKVGKNAMKDWHAAVRGWQSREKAQAPKVAEQPQGKKYKITM